MRARAALLVALAAGCITEPATQLLVAVDTDVADPAVLGAVDVEVRSAAGDAIYDRATFRVSPAGASPGVLALPFTFGVAPRNGDDAAGVRVVVRGRADGGAAVRVSATAAASYRAHRALVLPVFLARSCVDVVCADGQTCVEGACLDVPRADPARLQDVTGLPYAPPAHDAGALVCPAAQLACGGRCVDPLADIFHCGACDRACADGNRCEAGRCVSTGQCGPPYFPAGASVCAADYNTGECTAAPVVTTCTVMPDSCNTSRDSMPARSYTNRWAGEVITFPRPVRRMRFSFGGINGASCWLRFFDDTGASLVQPELHANCNQPTAPTPGTDVDFTAPATSAGVTRLWINHISTTTCFLSAMDLTYDP